MTTNDVGLRTGDRLADPDGALEKFCGVHSKGRHVAELGREFNAEIPDVQRVAIHVAGLVRVTIRRTRRGTTTGRTRRDAEDVTRYGHGADGVQRFQGALDVYSRRVVGYRLRRSTSKR